MPTAFKTSTLGTLLILQHEVTLDAKADMRINVLNSAYLSEQNKY